MSTIFRWERRKEGNWYGSIAIAHGALIKFYADISEENSITLKGKCLFYREANCLLKIISKQFSWRDEINSKNFKDEN